MRRSPDPFTGNRKSRRKCRPRGIHAPHPGLTGRWKEKFCKFAPFITESMAFGHLLSLHVFQRAAYDAPSVQALYGEKSPVFRSAFRGRTHRSPQGGSAPEVSGACDHSARGRPRGRALFHPVGTRTRPARQRPGTRGHRRHPRAERLFRGNRAAPGRAPGGGCARVRIL